MICCKRGSRSNGVSMAKRLFDLTSSFLGMLCLSPLMVAVALLVKATSRGPILFKQERMGRRFRPFLICKFRTMVQDAPKLGGQITCGEDPRITQVGRILRKTKIDELPQLFNVLKGDMSLVGPRPEAPKYVEMFHESYEEILQVRPGITDLASIKYRDEATVLAQAENPELAYTEIILPEKIRLAREYIRRRSFAFDLYLVITTIVKIGGDRLSSPVSKSVDVLDDES